MNANTYGMNSSWFPFWLPLLVILVVLIACQPKETEAYSAEENFAFIDKILNLLNNNQECELPTYEEVDELQKSFVELESELGQQGLIERLNDDQKLVQATLLDQWDSFSKRMNSDVVIRSAKKRAFLGKVEKYQEAKFKFSICLQIHTQNGGLADHIFEKNPLVRYIKHLETKNPVPDQMVSEGNEEESDILRTPIGSVEVSETRDKDGEDYDPLASIPVPVAAEQSSKSDCQCDNVCFVQISMDSNLDETGLTTKEPTRLETTTISSTTTETPAPVEQVTQSNEEVVDNVTEFGLDESSITGALISEVTTKSALDDSVADTTTVEPISQEVCNCSCPAYSALYHYRNTATTIADESETTTVTPQNAYTESVELPDDNNHATSASVKTREPKRRALRQYDELGRELVDKAFDDEDLKRLDVVFPPGVWTFVSRNGITEFKWPDEGGSKEEAGEDSGISVKEKWVKLLEGSDEEKEEDEDLKTDEPTVIEETTTVRPKFNGLAHRRRRKELLQYEIDEKAQRNYNAKFGWNEPKPTPPPKQENWAMMVDGKAVKIAYNSDYLKNSAGVKAVKSLFRSSSKPKDSGGHKRKKRIMS